MTLPNTFSLRAGPLGIGDFNGDGFDDVLWGGGLFLGSSAGLATSPALVLQAPDGGPIEIRWVYRAGDLDHDGFADVIVNGSSDSDASMKLHLFVYAGGARPVATPARVLQREGFELVASGDLTGDGVDDLLEIGSGDRVRVVDGDRTADVMDEPLGIVGIAVSPGDIDGDGRRDVVIGSSRMLVYRGGDLGGKPMATITRPDAYPWHFPAHLAGPGVR